MLRIDAPDGLATAFERGALQIEKHDGPVAGSTSANHSGMGHGDFVLDGEYFLSHGWQRDKVKQGPREAILRRVTWGADGWPRVEAPGHE
jgi:hypothetical protein